MRPVHRTEAILTRRAFIAASTALPTAAMLGGCSSPPSTSPAHSTEPTPPATSVPNSTTGLTFDGSFIFGLATSAYQVEGAVDVDGRGQSIWDTFCDRAGTIDDSSSGRTACDHYHRLPEDLDLLKSLNAQGYRFSIAWPRILPDGTGKINNAGLDFYRRLVDGLQQRGISATATLYHWDLPQALQDRGGWENRDSAEWFADYASRVFTALDGVDHWLTINEAKIIATQGYQLGWMAPGKTDAEAAGRVIHHLGLAHGRAVQRFRASGQTGTIGPCLQLSPTYPDEDTAEAKQAAEVADVGENTLYLDPILKGGYPRLTSKLDPDLVRGLRSAERDGDVKIISTPIDFIGVNYYSPTIVDAFGHPQTRYPVSSSGWQQIYPQGLYDLLRRLQSDYGVEIKITENGIPDDVGETAPADPARIAFLRDHLSALHRAIAEGTNVTAYYAWSLLDNFEWARGYTQRWGLVHVDFATLERTPKDSARWYAQLISSRSL